MSRINASKNVILLLILMGTFTEPALASRMSVTVPIANIRSGPGTNYEILWNVEKYHPLQVTEKKGNWYKFKDYEGDTGWVHSSLVKNIKSVLTKKKKCNVRSGPGTKYHIVFRVEKGVPFKVLTKEGNWVKIQHSDGDRGWIHKSLVW